MERYRRDQLPGAQIFAARLGNEIVSEGDDLALKEREELDPTVTCSAQPGRVGVHSGESHPRHTLRLLTRNSGELEEAMPSVTHYR